MGGKSSSSSQSTSTQIDARTAGDNGAFVVGSDAAVFIENTAPQAFEVALKAIDSSDEMLDSSLDFGKVALDGGVDIFTAAGSLIEDITTKAFDVVTKNTSNSQDTTLKAIAAIDEANTSDGNALADKLLTGASIIAIVMILKGGFK